MVKNFQDFDFNDKKLKNKDSITVNRNPTSDNELGNKKYIHDELDINTVLRHNQTLQNYLKVSAGKDTYNLTKYDKKQITDTTIVKPGNLLQKWNIKCNDRIIKGNTYNFVRSTKTNNPTNGSGAASKPPVGDSFMYIETSSKNHGNIVFVSFERFDNIEISNITFYYNRFSILTNDLLKSTGRFRIQFLSEDNTWSKRYTIPKKDRYSDLSTDWTLLSSNFTAKFVLLN